MNIPLFPLGSTLFPGGLLALKIFEVRYLDMTKACFKQQAPFGVVSLTEGPEVRIPGKEVEFANTGTLAHIIEFDAVQPSLYMLRCRGGQRFKILERTQAPNGAWSANIELMNADSEIDIPPELTPTSQALARLITSFEEQNVESADRPFLAPYRLNDCGWVANRWAELLNIPSAQKAHLLSMENPRLRLDLLQEMLEEMGAFKPPRQS
ncbi:Lon, substrate-binding domain containing protein [Burkholderiaceae bacterium]